MSLAYKEGRNFHSGLAFGWATFVYSLTLSGPPDSSSVK